MTAAIQSTQKQIVAADRLRAISMLDSAINNIGLYNGTSPAKVKNALSKHFGGATSTAFAKWIKINLHILRTLGPLAEYEIIATGSSFWACDSPGVIATAFWCVPFVAIRICPEYFNQTPDERSATLIHEWVHKYGCNLDLGYEGETSYSNNSTVTQLINADSFAQFAKDAQ